jgi:hypothetical protein
MPAIPTTLESAEVDMMSMDALNMDFLDNPSAMGVSAPSAPVATPPAAVTAEPDAALAASDPAMPMALTGGEIDMMPSAALSTGFLNNPSAIGVSVPAAPVALPSVPAVSAMP